ncbi:MAG: 2-amino-4-hydroxy-6-hydroxymethyldihydropteridine diphosphokinase [Myxococcaceae bacterium]|nr:2-amino-4-hydroxy-6-hydroxymethyldihydropteridine diphosphokinase [Myxococcaceae bacterium]MBH2006494.1 2-amino-4-hydroxy-6-hydroxymethyldihydropteridine diphosphokinase [Myxococcaceae bacterium]
MITYFLGVGSSHPQAPLWINKAEACLRSHPGIRFVAKSPNYPNPAFGGQTSFFFTNCAFRIQTSLHPNALWFLLHQIEMRLGRIRTAKNGPRTLDLDILDRSAGPMQTDYLQIPHPEFNNRPFALKPAGDIGFR